MKLSDENSNVIITTVIPPFGTVEIKLILADSKPRLLGTLNPKTNTLYLKRNPIKHLFRALDSYGFNWQLIDNEKFPYNSIVFTLGKKRYFFNREFVRENGVFQQHKKSGFELQLFVSKKLIMKQPSRKLIGK